MRIETNQKFIDLASRGLCGNTPKIYPSLFNAMSAAPYCANLTVSTRTWDNFRLYHQTVTDIARLMDQARRNDGMVSCQHAGHEVWANIASLYVYESPDASVQSARSDFQFDWIPADRYLIWNVSGQPWGRNKRSGNYRESRGVEALEVLRFHLGGSFSDLEELHEVYPTAVIEATYFHGLHMGCYGRDLLIWEVRDY